MRPVTVAAYIWRCSKPGLLGQEGAWARSGDSLRFGSGGGVHGADDRCSEAIAGSYLVELRETAAVRDPGVEAVARELLGQSGGILGHVYDLVRQYSCSFASREPGESVRGRVD